MPSVAEAEPAEFAETAATLAPQMERFFWWGGLGIPVPGRDERIAREIVRAHWGWKREDAQPESHRCYLHRPGTRCDAKAAMAGSGEARVAARRRALRVSSGCATSSLHRQPGREPTSFGVGGMDIGRGAGRMNEKGPLRAALFICGHGFTPRFTPTLF
jgi:hypothetical protein